MMRTFKPHSDPCVLISHPAQTVEEQSYETTRLSYEESATAFDRRVDGGPFIAGERGRGTSPDRPRFARGARDGAAAGGHSLPRSDSVLRSRCSHDVASHVCGGRRS